MRGLKLLCFQRSDISDLNWDEIGNCRALVSLFLHNLIGFPISEIQKLAACPIRNLELENTQLKDSDLENLMGLKQLGYLGLRRNIGITDVSFEYLEQMTSLDLLDVQDTSVTEEGIKEFNKKRPDVEVYSDFE